MFSKEFVICLQNLQSSKVLERKKASELFSELLNNKALLDALNKGEHERLKWDVVVEVLHKYLLKVSFFFYFF